MSYCLIKLSKSGGSYMYCLLQYLKILYFAHIANLWVSYICITNIHYFLKQHYLLNFTSQCIVIQFN
jgi:hypothetical protein